MSQVHRIQSMKKRGVRTSGFSGGTPVLSATHTHRIRSLPQRPKKISKDEPKSSREPSLVPIQKPIRPKRTLSALRRRRHSCHVVDEVKTSRRPPSSVRPRTASRGRPLSAAVVKQRVSAPPPPIKAPLTPSTASLKKSKPPPPFSSITPQPSSLPPQEAPEQVIQKFPAPGTSLRDFKFLEEIGQGGFSTVFKVRSLRDSHIYCAKKIAVRHLSSKELSQTLSEVYLMREMMHPHIIHMYSAFVEHSYLYIIMEYAESGDLHSLYLKQKAKKRFISEKTLWRFASQLCQALVYLHHTKNVMHRDVKTLNVFLTKRLSCKLGDLGMSRALKANQQFLQTNVGTPAYLSPEQIRGLPYDRKIDMWGLGVLLFTLASLRPPFQADNIMAMSRCIVHDPLPPLPKHYSSSFRSFVSVLLSKNPRRRPSARSCLSSIPSSISAEDPSFHSWSQPALDSLFPSSSSSSSTSSSHSANLHLFHPKPAPRSIKVKQFSFHS
mmetsp:Transcript_10334/g.15108  ORF Transcript_10334/g.15108 Transcript_10334/m.15108 type:complete len:494 (-) Transcript_10334:7-1488(-)